MNCIRILRYCLPRFLHCSMRTENRQSSRPTSHSAIGVTLATLEVPAKAGARTLNSHSSAKAILSWLDQDEATTLRFSERAT